MDKQIQAPRGGAATRPLALLAGLFLASAAGLWLSVEPWHPPDHVRSLCLNGAILMWALISHPRRHWAGCALAVLAGSLLALALIGKFANALFVVGAVTLVVVASAALAWRPFKRSLLDDFAQAGRFLAVAGVLLPMALSTWSLWARRVPAPVFSLDEWGHMVLEHSLAYLLVVPGLFGAMLLRDEPDRREGFTAPNLALAGGGLLALFVAWLSPWSSGAATTLAMLAPTAYLLATSLVFGAAAACVASLVISMLCLYLSTHGIGPLSTEPREQVTLAVQLWAMGNALVLLLVTIVHEQRRYARIALERAYERLTDLAGRMVQVQEEERSRIARDLHDDINQSLASVSIRISALKREIPEALVPSVEELQEQVLEVSGDIRRISHDLHPRVLKYTSLAASLSVLCEGHSTVDGLMVECVVPEDVPLSNVQKLNLFRVAQEALHNIEKHARAARARVGLARDGRDVVLTVEDDGQGPPGEAQTAARGLGMISMEERARTVGGRFRLTALPGHGTRIEVRVPLAG